MTALRRMPVNGSGRSSGKKARPASPAAEHTSEATAHLRYPIRSAKRAHKTSMISCVTKNVPGIRAIFPRGML